MVGDTLGHYRIDSRLGSGGMGVVYRAHDERLQRTVALKVVGGDARESTPDERARLLEEARAASHLTHPHICTVYEVGEIDGRVFIAMEFVEGRPLSELVPADGLPAETVVRYGEQIAGAVAHAHERGVVHRDLKSANIVIAPDSGAKVLDFGLARRTAAPGASQETQATEMLETGMLVGTLSYIAPEVLHGHVADARSDVWALGIVLYEAATGHLPFQGRTEYDLTAEILRSPVRPFPAHVPPMLRAIIVRCLAKEPSHRYQRAGEVRAALEAIHSDPLAGSPVAPAGARTSRRGWRMYALAAGLLGLAGIVWALSQARTSSPEVVGGGKLTRVVATEGRTFDPAISPDGRMLAYVAEDPEGHFDLYASRISGGARVRLTNDTEREALPRFSPDGEHVSYAVAGAGANPAATRILPALGGAIVATIANAGDAAWSPDGRSLTYIRRASDGRGPELVASATDGSNARVILPADSHYVFLRSPGWSPDGRTVAVVRSTGGIAGEIWLVPVDGGSPKKLLDEPEAVFSDWPTFTRDGRSIVHASNRGGATNIWAVAVGGGTPVQLTTGAGPDESPSIALDGTIAYGNSRWRNTLNVYDLGDASMRTLLTHSPFIWGPAVSPSGAEITFTRGDVDGSWHLWTLSLADGKVRQVTSSEAGEVYPRYAPDGASLFFYTWNAPRRIGRIATAGGPVTWPALGTDTLTFAAPSPDGRMLAVVRSDADAERVYTAPASGGTLARLTPVRGTLPAWSPDGSLIAYAGTRRQDGGIFVIGVDGTGERQVSKEGMFPVWWPDGREIGFVAAGPDGGGQIRVVSLRDGSIRTLPGIRLASLNHPFAVFPDGRRLVFGNAEHLSDEIWVLEPRRP
jgi:Tol biopolymer transport system component/predicted Ser/Thr protein kinase